MHPRTTPDDHLAQEARRRLQLLSAEIAEARGASRPPAAVVASKQSDPESLTPGRHAARPVSRGAMMAGWLHDRLPATMQGRVRLGVAQAGVLAVTTALGLALSAWWVLRTDDAGTLVSTSAPATAEPSALVTPAGTSIGGPAVTGARADTSTAPAAGTVVVDVTGRVRRPGIVTLPAGSRVIDALRAAGGARSRVDLGSLNQARLLVDGEQILVGQAPPTGPAASAVADSGSSGSSDGGALVNLNTADQATLESLPGVGPVTAQAIIAWREENGGFRSVDELLEVSGIGDATLAEVAPHVTL